MSNFNSKKSKKVFVAMSGGVDSSVAALLLQKEGYDATGVFMVNWREGCEWKEDRRDAMRVCAKLGIPFLTFDFEKEYKKEVIGYMTREYARGKTPNPDVMCNRKIKFGVFLKRALEMGADYIATGHYIKIKNLKIKMKNDNEKFKIIYKLYQAKDKNKDQSYFLWTLTQDELKHCLFPIGDYLKPEVRKMARKARLITANKKDSQGLCFVGKVKFDDFLKKLMEKDFLPNACKYERGPIYDVQKNKIGEHKGLCFYTIGQRSGLGIGGRKDTKEKDDSTALYVAEKDERENALIVASQNNPLLYKKELFVENFDPRAKKFGAGMNWIYKKPKKMPFECSARIRYRQPLQKCKVYLEKNDIAKVMFDKPQRAVAPGQSIVFYKGEKCLGGGIIRERQLSRNF